MPFLEFVEMFQRQIYSYCGCQVSKGQWSYIGVYAGNLYVGTHQPQPSPKRVTLGDTVRKSREAIAQLMHTKNQFSPNLELPNNI